MKEKAIFVFLILVSGVLFLPSCKGGRNKGQLPVDFVYDRTVCEECKMAISDPRYAAEVVEANGRAHFFDDPACVILWLSKRPNIGRVRIWVKDIKTLKWIEADKAHWIYGDPHTPMGYGYAATASPVKKSLDWNTVKKYVLIGKTLVNENLAKRLDVEGEAQPTVTNRPGTESAPEAHKKMEIDVNKK